MSRSVWLATKLLRLYPQPWRERYGPEMAALLEEHSVRLRTLVDLISGAIDARFHATYGCKEGSMSRSDRQEQRRYTRCSFCGKGQDQVKKLVAGPGVYICNMCIELCNEVLAEDSHFSVGASKTQGGPHDGGANPPRRSRRWRVSLRHWLRVLWRSSAPQAT